MEKKELYVALEVERNQSIGPLLRCCSAFGVQELITVGSSVFSTYGAHGAERHFPVEHKFYWEEFSREYKESKGYKIVGILNKFPPVPHIAESGKPVLPILQLPIDQSMCFIVPSSFDLTPEQIALCDVLVYSEVPNPEKGYFVHINAKISICLQWFALQAGFSPTEFDGGKHDVHKYDPKTRYLQNQEYFQKIKDAKPKKEKITLEECFDEDHSWNIFQAENN